MHVKSVHMRGFTSHDDTTINLPERGIVTITGENGAGKSSFVEAVSWGGWGKTLRGTTPWRGDAHDPPCAVRLDTNELVIDRTRTGSKTKLEWIHLEGANRDAPGASSADPEFDTASKAQDGLARLLGPFDLWRRSHVFSSADASHFTHASDGDRKRLIETFLGNDRFDPALELCRADLKAAQSKLANASRMQEVAAAKLEAARARLKESKQALAAANPPAAPPARSAGKPLSEYDETLKVAHKEVFAARDKLRAADRAGANWEAQGRAALALLDRLRAPACPTCKQAITEKLRNALKLDAADAKQHAATEKTAADVGRADIEAALEEVESEIAAIQAARNSRAVELAAERQREEEADRYARQRKLLEATFRAADEAIGQLTIDLVECEERIDELTSDVGELSATETVLGMKGVRAHILGKSLAGIEAVANSWLARLHEGDLQVVLRPYSELKKGGVEDSISLEVTGAGGGLGYKASSGGERRRLDLAMLLALAEISAASRGEVAGTLFFDECLDALDEVGCAAFVSALQDLAKDRAVVVITHSRTLLERLPGAQRLRVAHGRLEALGSP